MSLTDARSSIRRALTQLGNTPLANLDDRLRRADLEADLREAESKLTDLLNRINAQWRAEARKGGCVRAHHCTHCGTASALGCGR